MVVASSQRTNGIVGRVHRIFLDGLELEVDLQTDVIENGLLDSIGFVQLLVELEREFGIEVDIADLELDHFRSVSRIADFVAAHQSAMS